MRLVACSERHCVYTRTYIDIRLVRAGRHRRMLMRVRRARSREFAFNARFLRSRASEVSSHPRTPTRTHTEPREEWAKSICKQTHTHTHTHGGNTRYYADAFFLFRKRPFSLRFFHFLSLSLSLSLSFYTHAYYLCLARASLSGHLLSPTCLFPPFIFALLIHIPIHLRERAAHAHSFEAYRARHGNVIASLPKARLCSLLLYTRGKHVRGATFCHLTVVPLYRRRRRRRCCYCFVLPLCPAYPSLSLSKGRVLF